MSDVNIDESADVAPEEDTPSDDINEPAEKGLPKVSVRLSEARIARGLSRQDLAEQLFLGVGFIKNIDEGEFEKIKKPAFLKGYLRSYARELGLSGDEIIATYEAELQESASETIRLRGVTEQRVGSANFTGPVATTGIYSLIAIVSILVAIWWFSPDLEKPVVTSSAVQQKLASDERDDLGDTRLADYMREAAVLETATNEPVVDSEIPTETASSPLSETATLDEQLAARALLFDDSGSSSGEADQEVSSSVEGSFESESAELADASDANQAEILIERGGDLESQLITVAAGGDDHLQFVFTDDCWLEVKDASGNLIYGDLNHDKEVLSLFGVAPFKLLVGKVSAVTVTYNDRTVSFAGNTFNDTAKLVVE